MAKDDKLKALDAAIAQIERQYGKGRGSSCSHVQRRGTPGDEGESGS